MAAKKAKNAVNGRARKKSAKSAAVRGGAKAGAKRTRRATGSKTKPRRAVKSPRAARRADVASPVAERKPAKKAEPRPQRPPAVLPIPQSTFFF